jgi:hypothetical protein
MLIGTLVIVRTVMIQYFHSTVDTMTALQQRTLCSQQLYAPKMASTGTVTITQVLYVDPVVTDFLVLVKYCDLKTTR